MDSRLFVVGNVEVLRVHQERQDVFDNHSNTLMLLSRNVETVESVDVRKFETLKSSIIPFAVSCLFQSQAVTSADKSDSRVEGVVFLQEECGTRRVNGSFLRRPSWKE